MTSRRLADDSVGENRLRWPAIPPLVITLWIYLGMLHIPGVWLFVTTRFPPNDAVVFPLQRPLLLDWTILEWVILCNFAWMVLFAFEWALAVAMPPTARRSRRIYAALAMLGLVVVQLETWALVRALAS